MPALVFENFLGERPIAHPHKLGEAEAQTARNVHLYSGALQPMKATALERAATTAGTPQTIFRYTDATWLEFTGEVDVFRSPIPNDAFDRVYFFNDPGTAFQPRVTDNALITSGGGGGPFPAISRRLGVPAPAAAPPVALGGVADDPDDLAESRFYVVTYVNAWGEEGPPSLASLEVEVKPGQTVTVTLPGNVAGDYELVTQRIYRLNTDIFQFVAERSIVATSYQDPLTSAQLGEELPSLNWDPPPADLTGATLMDGGFVVAFRKNELLPSETGLPHAYPTRYRLPTAHDIVAVEAFGNAAAVLTEGVPYVLAGTDPSSLLLQELDDEQACVSRASAVSVPGGVAYASPDGLVLIGTNGLRVLTESLMHRNDWQTLVPSSIRGAMWNGLYVGFYNNGTPGAFILNPRNPGGGMGFFDIGAVGGLYNALEDDELFVAVGGEIRKWDAGAAVSYTWRSRPFEAAARDTIRVLQVFADGYPVTVDVIADDEVIPVTVTSDRAVRFVGSRVLRRHRNYAVEVRGTQRVRKVVLASSMTQLREF